MGDHRRYVWSETLRNGLSVTIRPLEPDDRERVATAVRELGRESIYTRLFSHRSELTEAGLDRIMRVDPMREAALLVTRVQGDDEIVIGSGRFMAPPGEGALRAAEIAFVVDYSLSMADNNKYIRMTDAAKKFLGKVSTERGDRTKVGLVPFSEYVYAALPGSNIRGTPSSQSSTSFIPRRCGSSPRAR